MVARVHRRIGRIAVPQFPDRRGALVDHITPTRIGTVRSDRVSQVALAVLGQAAHQELDSDQAGADMAVEFALGFFHDIFEHLALQRIGGQILHQRQNVSRHRVVGVLTGFGIQEHLVISALNIGGELLVSRNIGLVAADCGEFAHNVQQTVVETGREQAAVGFAGRIGRVDQFLTFGRHTPVAVHVVDNDIILHLRVADEIHPLFQRSIMLLDRAAVAVLVVQHIGHANVSGGPGYVAGVLVERPESRSHVGHATVFALDLFDILQPLFVKQRMTEHETFADATHRAVAEPSHTLVALRTVGRHTAVIAANTPERIVVNLVDRRIGRLERTDRFHPVVIDFPFEIFQLGLVVQSGNLYETEPVIGETGFPAKQAVRRRRIDVGHVRAAQVVHIQAAVVLQRFGETHLDRLVLLPFQRYSQPSDQILPHIDDVSTVVQLVDRNRVHRIHRHDVRIALSDQFASRSAYLPGLHPRAVVEAVFVPALHLIIGVILLAVEFVVGDDRAVGGQFPTVVADYDRFRTVFISDFQLCQQLRVAELTQRTEQTGRRIAQTHREIAPVAEDHPDRILLVLQELHHVENIVVDRLRIVGSRRCEDVLVDLAAVQVAFVKAQSANV